MNIALRKSHLSKRSGLSELGTLIELMVLEQTYLEYHGPTGYSKKCLLEIHYADFAKTGELPFFAKRVLGLL